MSRAIHIGGFALLAATAAAAPAGAVVIDFNDLGSPTESIPRGSARKDGFVVSMSGGVFRTLERNSSYNADPSGYNIINNNPGAAFLIERDDGDLFDFRSIDLSDGFNNQFRTASQDIEFLFYRDSGVTSQTVTIDGAPGQQTFVFGQSGLRRFTVIAPFIGYVGIDNVNVTVAAAVPEPATWAMMTLGFGLAGATVRRRRERTLPA